MKAVEIIALTMMKSMDRLIRVEESQLYSLLQSGKA